MGEGRCANPERCSIMERPTKSENFTESINPTLGM